MTPDVPPPDETTLRRQAFILSQLNKATGQRLRLGDINRRIRTRAARDLGFDPAATAHVRDTLVAAGDVEVVRQGRSAWYALTPAGAQRLEGLAHLLPSTPAPAGRVVPPSSEAVRRARVAYLLLQLLQAGDEGLSSAEANRPTAQSRELDLTPATARACRQELAAGGLLGISREGRTERYILTPAGRLHLGALAFHDGFEFRLSGRALSDLLEAAREVGKQFAPTGAPPAAAATPSAVEAAVLAAFEDLRQERHAVDGLVPIHSVRAAVARALGPAAARHDAFDEAVLRLWRAKRFRLSPIADRSRATADELQASLPGVGETLFYLEAAREPAAV